MARPVSISVQAAPNVVQALRGTNEAKIRQTSQANNSKTLMLRIYIRTACFEILLMQGEIPELNVPRGGAGAHCTRPQKSARTTNGAG